MGKNGKKFKKSNSKLQKKTEFHDKPKQEYFSYGKYSKKPVNGQPLRPSLREDQVGITEYVNKNIEGFTAVIKSRYSDFHVNEIDLNNKVLILDDYNLPKHPEDSEVANNTIAQNRALLKDIISEENWLKIDELSNSGKDNTTAEPIEININGLGKGKRTEIHEVMKNLYGGRLVSSTFTKKTDSSEIKYLRIAKATGSRAEQRVKWAFPGEYVRFLVRKENLDTTEVASKIARYLSLMPSKVNYCGTKDKRAVTTQMFSVKRRTPHVINNACKKMHNVRVGNFSFADNTLRLGELRGNRFRIALRNVNAEKDLMVKALEQLKQFGFINFYGLQRFGNCSDIPTYEVGIALMKADYKTACELILKPRAGDIDFLKVIREKWWNNRDSKEAARMFRTDRFIEKKLLDGLAKHGENDYATALRKLPRNLLLLYPHAVQSLIFNRIASKRIKEYGLKLIPGDLVYLTPSDETQSEAAQVEISADDSDISMNEGNDDNEDENVANTEDENIANTEDENVANTEDKEKAKVDSPSRLRVYTLTEDDISSNKYTIYDVVLPLPGFDIQYPQNELNEWYKEMLNEYGLTSESFNHKIKTFKLSGAYRKLLILPKDLTWEFYSYEKYDAQLLHTDKEKARECKNRFPYEKFETDPTLNKALIIQFSLPPAAYATMLLRELLKADTSSTNQLMVEIEAISLKRQEKLNANPKRVAKTKKSKKLDTEDPTSNSNENTTEDESNVLPENRPAEKEATKDESNGLTEKRPAEKEATKDESNGLTEKRPVEKEETKDESNGLTEKRPAEKKATKDESNVLPEKRPAEREDSDVQEAPLAKVSRTT